MKIKTFPIVLVAVILVIGMIASSFAISRLFIRMEKDRDIRVKGYAERMVKSDRGSFYVTLTVEHKTLQEAYKKLNAQSAILMAKIKESGFNDKEIKVFNVGMKKCLKRDINGRETNEIDFFQLQLPVTVSSSNVDAIEQKHKCINDLLLDGIEVQVCNPEYYIDGVDKYKIELLAAATLNGQERAAQIARSGGSRVGRLVSAQQGVFQITAPDSGDISDYGEYDRSCITKNAKIVVTLTYILE